jgi:hypothetical protein|tara:strand:+ start:260 stop:460 length:201 start_codon:yes stop_codon:yes gene_type:complete
LTEHARELGLEDFHILIVQETVYNSLSTSYQELFTKLDLAEDSLKEGSFLLMYDSDARYVYFHILD